MTGEQLDRVHELRETLWSEVHDLVDARLEGEEPEIEELVRTQMTEQFRFWRRRPRS